MKFLFSPHLVAAARNQLPPWRPQLAVTQPRESILLGLKARAGSFASSHGSSYVSSAAGGAPHFSSSARNSVGIAGSDGLRHTFAAGGQVSGFLPNGHVGIQQDVSIPGASAGSTAHARAM